MIAVSRVTYIRKVRAIIMRKAGRHFLQIPGPSAVPDRILSAIGQQTIDHRGPDFAKVGLRALNGLKTIFKTEQHVFVYPASGTGAWEAALVNTLSPGDRVLMFETGHFSTLWKKLAEKLGLNAEFIEGDWRGGADPRSDRGLFGRRPKVTRSKPYVSSTMKPQRVRCRRLPRCAKPSTGPTIRHCSWWIRFRALHHWTISTTNGVLTLRCRVHKRG